MAVVNSVGGSTYIRSGNVIKSVGGETYYVTDEIKEYGGELKAGNIYKATINTDTAFTYPDVAGDVESSILIYVDVTASVTITWGDVLFYGNAVPEVGIGKYEFIFIYDPNAAKWCVAVLEKGSGE